MDDDSNRAYMLVAIQPGKQQEFADEIMSLGLTKDSAVDRIDFVHGSYDFIISFKGTSKEIDGRIWDIRSLPHLLRTETMIPFHNTKAAKGSKRHRVASVREAVSDNDHNNVESIRLTTPIYMGRMLDATHPPATVLGHLSVPTSCQPQGIDHM